MSQKRFYTRSERVLLEMYCDTMQQLILRNRLRRRWQQIGVGNVERLCADSIYDCNCKVDFFISHAPAVLRSKVNRL